MKTTLNLLLLVLAIATYAAMFAGLMGILPHAAFVTGEAALFAFSFVGLMLLGMVDDGRGRRPLVIAPPQPAARAPHSVPPPYRPSYGIRRRESVLV